MTAVLLLTGVALAGVAAAVLSYRSGARIRLLLALGSPLLILLGNSLAVQTFKPCANAEGECYGELGYAILAFLLFVAIELGTLFGLVAAWAHTRRAGR